LDGSADVASGGDLNDAGAANDTLDSPNDGEVSDLSSERSDAAPAEKSRTQGRPAESKTPDNKSSAADKKAIEDFEKISGLRIHKEDALKLKELIKGAYGAFEKSAKLQQLFKPENRDELFKALDIDPDSFAAERLSKRLEERLQSPEEKARTEEQKELEQLRAEKKAREEQDAQKELSELEQREIARIDREWSDALKQSGLPARKENLRRMAEIARDYLVKKHVELPIEHIAEIVREEREHQDRERMRADIEEAPAEAFDAFMKKLSPKASKRIRDWFIAQVRRPPQQGGVKPQPSGNAPPVRRRASAAPISPDEFREKMGL
jgi:hypothetical protein